VVKELGFRYVVCESMGRIYFRNCIALGVYPVMSKGVSNIFDEGDEVEIDLEKGEIRNARTGESATFEPLSGTPKDILDSGGIISMIKKITEGVK
jgi:3-isopropylmalate dehydratase small subunit